MTAVHQLAADPLDLGDEHRLDRIAVFIEPQRAARIAGDFHGSEVAHELFFVLDVALGVDQSLLEEDPAAVTAGGECARLVAVAP